MKRALVYPLKQSRRLMQKLINKTSRKSGLAPGTLIHIGEKKIDKPKITVIDYDAAGVQEKVVSQVEDCFPSKDSPTVSWINIDGLHQVDLVEKIGRHFNIHPLILEDIVHTGQRPKLDEVDDNLFIVLKMLTYDVQEQDIKAEQVSMILAPHVLISFQEAEGEVEPRVELAAVEDLPDYFPAGAAMADQEYRQQQLEQRRRHVARRWAP